MSTKMTDTFAVASIKKTDKKTLNTMTNPTTFLERVRSMSIKEIEEESESLKSTAEILSDKETRAFDLNTELIRRYKEQIQ